MDKFTQVQIETKDIISRLADKTEGKVSGSGSHQGEKKVLKEKRDMQKQLEQLKAQNKERDRDVEFARLQKHSRVLSDLATLAEAYRSL